MTAAVALLFGLAFGSFANAAIDRIASGTSLHGRSRCDACHRTLTALELLPVVSYLALRSRCAGCQATIGVRSPLVEATCAVAFVAAFAAIGAPATISLCAVAIAAIALASATTSRIGAPR